MNRSFAPQVRIAVLSVATSLLAITAGCSTGGTSTMMAPKATPLAVENASKKSAPGGGAGSSVNNARDLAAAQSETVVNGLGSARDIDLSGGGGGGTVQPLSPQTLGTMLQGMGLQPVVDREQFILRVKATVNNTDYTYPIAVGISQNRTLVWISCEMAQLDKSNGVTPQSIMNLLAANAQLAPSFFSVDQQNWLVIQRPVTNAGITPEVLGYNLKSFLANVKAAEPLYKPFMTIAGSDQGGGNQGGGNQGGGDQGGNPFK